MTFSIVARSADGGELGVAVASKFLAVGAAVPAAASGAGALATQAWANLRYRPKGLALLAAGGDAASVVAELTAAAELQTRVDRKYVLTRAQAGTVLRDLAPDTRVLEIDGTRAMAYESVYFDTRDLLSYRMAAHARRRSYGS